MRIIEKQRRLDIEDAVNAGFLKLPPAVAEKDIHITDVLQMLSSLSLSHTAFLKDGVKRDPRPREVDVRTRLVFAGGTCLSKAHKAIERMSEDIDIKVILESPPDGYGFAKEIGDRARLKALHAKVENSLTSMGFEFSLQDGDNPRARDNRRYYCLAVDYSPVFEDTSGALRPQLKLELINRHPRITPERKAMRCLLDSFRPVIEPSAQFEMEVISVAETLAEKVVSFLRRCAWGWSGLQQKPMDDALVRHVYDVWRIANQFPEAIAEGSTIFSHLVETDVNEFKGQHPAFDENPFEVLEKTLERARNHEELINNFDRKLKPLLFSSAAPEYATCFDTFENVALTFLKTAQTSLLR